MFNLNFYSCQLSQIESQSLKSYQYYRVYAFKIFMFNVHGQSYQIKVLNG